MAIEVTMNTVWKRITILLLATVILSGPSGCGTGNDRFVEDSGENPAPSGNVTVKTGTIYSDSWGYTGSSPIQVTAPGQTEISIRERTLLMDAAKSVVSGAITTRISFSSDKTTLTSAAQASVPANAIFVSYVNILLGSARSAIPELSVTVDVGAALSGTTLTVYNYDAGIGRWTSAQTAVVSSSGRIVFPVSQLSLWGIFRQ
jgi:hypothetical protein